PERREVAVKALVSAAPALAVLSMVVVILAYYDARSRADAPLEGAAPMEMGLAYGSDAGTQPSATGLAEPPSEAPPPSATGLAEPPPEPSTEQLQPTGSVAEPAASGPSPLSAQAPPPDAAATDSPQGFDWGKLLIGFTVILGGVSAWFYWRTDYKRLHVLQLLLKSFFPLTMLILMVLGSIVFGLATPTEAAAIGSLGGVVLALLYRQLTWPRLKESVFLTARTTAMVCWLFVGSSIFSASFALLGGQALIEQWVLSMDLSPIQFMLLAQAIIFLLGWPLEWTEIIVIFMPIFIPLLSHFNIDPLFFGLLVALNLQTAFLSPPVAMAAFYLKGVSPPHVTLNQIFAGMMPFMVIQIIALALLYMFPQIGLWLPNELYK
ncbi:MAG: TRAP transporter large permease subunit, partial [Betaproteobacteria bacterium]|nr:TRAP transporter large permease subunit [Betaproteobacteria bacterium]